MGRIKLLASPLHEMTILPRVLHPLTVHPSSHSCVILRPRRARSTECAAEIDHRWSTDKRRNSQEGWGAAVRARKGNPYIQIAELLSHSLTASDLCNFGCCSVLTSSCLMPQVWSRCRIRPPVRSSLDYTKPPAGAHWLVK